MRHCCCYYLYVHFSRISTKSFSLHTNNLARISSYNLNLFSCVLTFLSWVVLLFLCLKSQCLRSLLLLKNCQTFFHTMIEQLNEFNCWSRISLCFSFQFLYFFYWQLHVTQKKKFVVFFVVFLLCLSSAFSCCLKLFLFFLVLLQMKFLCTCAPAARRRRMKNNKINLFHFFFIFISLERNPYLVALHKNTIIN